MNSKALLEMDDDISRATDTFKDLSGTISSNLSRIEDAKIPSSPVRRTRSERKTSIISNGPLPDIHQRWETEGIPDLEIPPEPLNITP
jgi:hypothetical protein